MTRGRLKEEKKDVEKDILLFVNVLGITNTNNFFDDSCFNIFLWWNYVSSNIRLFENCLMPSHTKYYFLFFCVFFIIIIDDPHVNEYLNRNHRRPNRFLVLIKAKDFDEWLLLIFFLSLFAMIDVIRMLYFSNKHIKSLGRLNWIFGLAIAPTSKLYFIQNKETNKIVDDLWMFTASLNVFWFALSHSFAKLICFLLRLFSLF